MFNQPLINNDTSNERQMIRSEISHELTNFLGKVASGSLKMNSDSYIQLAKHEQI